ncbi:MAG TPA: SAM-dependent methyltransferase [Ruminococcus sp.]|nr:SAM-dependent methyltransferase [Ruminococcus sp.]
MSTTHKIELKEELFNAITEACLLTFREKKSIDVISIMERLMDIPGIPMHYPYHHFIVPASLLTAAAMQNINKNEDELKEELETAKGRAKQVPGGFCGFCGACGAGIGAGIFMSVITESSPMSEETWQWCNEVTSVSLSSISSVSGPRCCKRTCFLSAQAAVPYIREKLSISLPMPKEINCKYSANNPTCKKELCPFYSKH